MISEKTLLQKFLMFRMKSGLKEREGRKPYHPRETACKSIRLLMANPASGPQFQFRQGENLHQFSDSSLYRLGIYCYYSRNPSCIVVSVHNLNSSYITLVVVSFKHFFQLLKLCCPYAMICQVCSFRAQKCL